MRKVKLVALDMDGTVLNSKSELTDENKKILDKAAERGIFIVLCTGRTLTELYPCLDRFDKVRYAICTNGGFAVDLKTAERIYEELLPFNEAHNILKEAKNMDVAAELFIDGQAFLEKSAYDDMKTYHIERFKDLLSSTCKKISDAESFLLNRRQDIEKMNLFCKDAEKRAIMLDVCLRYNVSATFSLSYNVEVNSPFASKGKCLEFVCDYLKLKREEVMAFGDSLNDLSMLQYAGISVAMGNAIEEVKRSAAILAPSNEENGVARVLEGFI